MVVRLKGGDPIIFGRGGEEMEALHRAKISYEVVPAVTSAAKGFAYAGIPLSDRRWSSAITFLTGQESETMGPRVSNIDWGKNFTPRHSGDFDGRWCMAAHSNQTFVIGLVPIQTSGSNPIGNRFGSKNFSRDAGQFS